MGFSVSLMDVYPGLDHILGHLQQVLNLSKMRSLWLIVGFDLEWFGTSRRTKSKQETDISPKTINRKQLLQPRRPNIPESFSSERPNSSRPSNNATCPPNLPTPPPPPPPCPRPTPTLPNQNQSNAFLSADSQTMPGGSRSLISPIPPSPFIPLLKNVWKGDTENSKKKKRRRG